MMRRDELDLMLRSYDASHNSRHSDAFEEEKKEIATSTHKLHELKEQFTQLSQTHAGLKYTEEYLKTSQSKLKKNKNPDKVPTVNILQPYETVILGRPTNPTEVKSLYLQEGQGNKSRQCRPKKTTACSGKYNCHAATRHQLRQTIQF